MTKPQLKTDYKLKMERRDMAIYTEYERLIKEDGAMPGAVDDYLMKRYDLHTRSSIWNARRRGAQLHKQQEEKN